MLTRPLWQIAMAVWLGNVGALNVVILDVEILVLETRVLLGNVVVVVSR